MSCRNSKRNFVSRDLAAADRTIGSMHFGIPRSQWVQRHDRKLCLRTTVPWTKCNPNIIDIQQWGCELTGEIAVDADFSNKWSLESAWRDLSDVYHFAHWGFPRVLWNQKCFFIKSEFLDDEKSYLCFTDWASYAAHLPKKALVNLYWNLILIG